VINILDWLHATKPDSGIYNLGTGTARTFLDLVQAVFSATAVNPLIDWVDIPVDIRDTYQYFTEADMSKLRSVGYTDSFYTLEAGINDYVTNYLSAGKYY
jgi:ADP-L-glycero-D-manno-heptose 6-epimerase